MCASPFRYGQKASASSRAHKHQRVHKLASASGNSTSDRFLCYLSLPARMLKLENSRQSSPPRSAASRADRRLSCFLPLNQVFHAPASWRTWDLFRPSLR